MSSLTLGTIASWISPKDQSAVVAVWNALRNAGLDPAIMKEMSPIVAFNRAMKDMSKQRIIRRVERKKNIERFQFTREFLDSGELRYTKECDVVLDKATGAVTSENLEIQNAAQKLLNDHRAVRDSADITRMIQRIFKLSKGDLVPIRQQGGCYFVPESNTAILTQVRAVLKELKGELREWSISGASPETRATVAVDMSQYMFGLIDDLEAKCGTINEETRPDVLERRFEEIALISSKLDANHSLMENFATLIRDKLTAAAVALECAASGQPVPVVPVTEDFITN